MGFSGGPGVVLEGRSCLLSLLISSDLEQQVEQLVAQIEKVREQVSFMSTYKDHEYPIKLVQVANLMRQLQQVKDSQLVGEPLVLPHLTLWEAGLVANTFLLTPRMS